MAATDATTPTAAADVVAVLRQDTLEQVFPDARPIRATVKVEAKAMEHPVEDGATITDHRIILPTEIELSTLIAVEDYRSVYDTLAGLFRDATLLIVQTRAATYEPMLITAIPHDETPDMSTALPVAIRLKQVQIVQAQYGTLPPRKVANPKDSSTAKGGQKDGQTPSASKQSEGSTAYRLFGSPKASAGSNDRNV